MRKILILASIVFCIQYAQSQTVTFAEHVAPIIYKHCTTCHRQGEIAPFPLTSYEEVKNRGAFIKYVTQIQYMPPWKPDKNIRKLQNENFLSDEEIATLAAWVDQGMQRGDVSKEPPVPVFPSGSQVGNPDMVVSFAQSYLHKGTGIDEYRYFVLPTNLTEDKYLVALEVRPGNKKVVHHTLVWADSTDISRNADAATPEYGFEGSSNTSVAQINNQLPGYVPGQKPIIYQDGLALKIPKGSDLLLQMHYAPSATDEKDSTSINLFFSKEPPKRLVQSFVMLPVPGILQGDVFIIPPNQVKTFHGMITLPYDVTLLGVAPHMHLLGQNWHIYCELPDGKIQDALKISDWDFNWQGSYHFTKPMILPRGTKLHAFATYDNTVNNPHNPNNPPKVISWGEKTSDEMYYLPLIFLNYQPGDENLEFHDVLSNDQIKYDFVKDKIYPVYPAPAKDVVTIPFTISRPQRITVEITDLNGKVLITKYNETFAGNGMFKEEINISNLVPGTYLAVVKAGRNRMTQKFIKQ